MKYFFVIIAAISLLLVSCNYTGWAIIGGVSEKTASKNLAAFLKENYPKLDYKNVKRFFNSGNMNPNMFMAEVYETNRPEISFAVFFDAKKIVGTTDIPSQYLDGPSFSEIYKKQVIHADTMLKLEHQLKEYSVHISTESYNTLILNFEKETTENEIRLAAEQCIIGLNELSNGLNFHSNIALKIKDTEEKFDWLLFIINKNVDHYTLQSIRCDKESFLFKELKNFSHKYLIAQTPEGEELKPQENTLEAVVNPNDYSALSLIQFYDPKTKPNTPKNFIRAIGYKVGKVTVNNRIDLIAQQYHPLPENLGYHQVVLNVYNNF